MARNIHNTLNGIGVFSFNKKQLVFEFDNTNKQLVNIKLLAPVQKSFVIDMAKSNAKTDFINKVTADYFLLGLLTKAEEKQFIEKTLIPIFKTYQEDYSVNKPKPTNTNKNSKKPTPINQNQTSFQSKKYFIYYHSSNTNDDHVPGFYYAPNAQPIIIPGYENHEFFTWKNEHGAYTVTEAKSGASVGLLSTNKQTAISNAVDQLNTATIDQLNQLINKQIKANGISPRFITNKEIVINENNYVEVIENPKTSIVLMSAKAKAIKIKLKLLS